MLKLKVAAIIVAAGSGKRIGGEIPKQFIEIAGKPILQHTLEKFQQCEKIDEIFVILPAAFTETYDSIIRNDWKIQKLVRVVKGGVERFESVHAGLKALDDKTDIVMIHDGVRPFVSLRILKDSIAAADKFGAAVVGLVPKDTVKKISGDHVVKTIERDHLLLAQTPQTFRYDVILKANEMALQQKSFSTDDSALVEQMGHPVAIVEGDWKNIKITSREDLIIAKAFFEDGE